MAPKTPPHNPHTHTRTPSHATHTIPAPTDITSTDSPLHFSPSKARAHAAQTQQLTQLTRWLSTLLSTSDHPTTDATTLVTKWTSETRNDTETTSATTQWLQAVQAQNGLADERNRLVFEAARAEVDTDVGRDDDHPVVERLLREVYANLTPAAQSAVDSLAETAVLLGRIPAMDSAVSLGGEFGQAVMEHTVRAHEVHEQVERVRGLQRTVSKRTERARAELELFDGERRAVLREAEQMHPQMAQWNRETKQIAVKIKEYQERVAALERSGPGSGGALRSEDRVVRIEDVTSLQQRVSERRAAVAKLEEALKALNGLPPDLEASRQEVKRAKIELERLKARREELFTMIAKR